MNAFLDNFHLLRPWALALLVPALLLWWFGRQAADTTRRWARVIDAGLLKHLVVGGETGRRLGAHDLLLVGWVVAALAVAGPTWQREPSPFAAAVPPVMIVLKVAPSMNAADLAPTRLDRARQKIADLLAAREGGAAGLIAYSGSAHLVLPPTPDRDVVIGMAGALSVEIMPREGDRLADAVKLAAQVLRDGGQGGSVLVVTDTVAPDQAEALKDAGAPLTVLAVAPQGVIAASPALRSAVATTIDDSDVRALVHALSSRAGVPTTPGETERWQEAGYWLGLPLAALVLFWFRRGWVIAT